MNYRKPFWLSSICWWSTLDGKISTQKRFQLNDGRSLFKDHKLVVGVWLLIIISIANSIWYMEHFLFSNSLSITMNLPCCDIQSVNCEQNTLDVSLTELNTQCSICWCAFYFFSFFLFHVFCLTSLLLWKNATMLCRAQSWASKYLKYLQRQFRMIICCDKIAKQNICNDERC